MLLAAGAASGASYILGPRDILSISVYEQEDLTQRIRIAEEGTVNLPLIGVVQVAGLTVEELGKVLVGRYREFIRDPQVQVFVVEYHSKEISVLGEVRRPGLYKLSGNTTLLEVISSVGGLAENHADTLVVLREKGEKAGMSETIIIDIGKLLSVEGQDLNIQVQDGDVINVPKRVSSKDNYFLMGQVRSPGPYTMPKDGSTLTVYKAISIAGGFTEKASKRRIKIRREVGEQTMEFKADLDTLVRTQDIIIVPESFF